MWTIYLSLLCLIGSAISGLSPDHTQKLKQSLLRGYDPSVRPNDELGNIGNVSFTIKPICLHLSPLGTIYGKVWYVMSWVDHRLKWNSSWKIESLTLPHDAVWKPDIVAYKGEDGDKYSDKYPIILFPNGKVIFIPSVNFYHACFDPANHPKPNDTVTCDVPFGSWTHDGDVMNLDFYNGKPEADISSYDSDTCWTKILPSPATREAKHYPGVPHKYVTLVFHLKLVNMFKAHSEEREDESLWPTERFSYKLLKP